MALTIQLLLWGSIGSCIWAISLSPMLTTALKRNWQTLCFILLIAFLWRLPFDGHFFSGLEYEDSYVYPVAARYLLSHSQSQSKDSFRATVCAVGNWESCVIPETSSGHLLGYPFIIATISKVIGYNPSIANYVSIAASLSSVVVIFLIGELIEPGGVLGLAAAAIFSLVPVFGVFGVGSYAEPLSNLLIVLCLLMFTLLLTLARPLSMRAFLITWTALTFTELLATVVKRENVLVIPVLLLTTIVFEGSKSHSGVKKICAAIVVTAISIIISAYFAIKCLSLPAMLRQEHQEYSQFPFSLQLSKTMIPLFLKGYVHWSWYFGSTVLVLISLLFCFKRKPVTLFPLVLFLSYFALYVSHVRSYYQLHGGSLTEIDSLRYSMNLAGLFALMAGLGFSWIVEHLSSAARKGTFRVCISIVCGVCVLGSWVTTDRLKEDMVANERVNRLLPAEAMLRAVAQVGTPDTFAISLEPLVIQMLARNPINIIDFKDFNPSLLRELLSTNPHATFFYLEQTDYTSPVDIERYRESFESVHRLKRHYLGGGDGYAIFEIFDR